MSYPWWRFTVAFDDGADIEYTATGVTPTDALRELLSDVLNEDDDIGKAYREHGEILAVVFMHCDTFGIDPESDAILLAENPELRRDILFEEDDEDEQTD